MSKVWQQHLGAGPSVCPAANPLLITLGDNTASSNAACVQRLEDAGATSWYRCLADGSDIDTSDWKS
jgi:hypothetical protein